MMPTAQTTGTVFEYSSPRPSMRSARVRQSRSSAFAQAPRTQQSHRHRACRRDHRAPAGLPRTRLGARACQAGKPGGGAAHGHASARAWSCAHA
eukprot:2983328-Prymnesium_polylepis.1